MTVHALVLSAVLLAPPGAEDDADLAGWSDLLRELGEDGATQRHLEAVRARLGDGGAARALGRLSWEPLEEAAKSPDAAPVLRDIIAEKWRRTPHGGLVQLAGNAGEDAVRLRHLKRLRWLGEQSGAEIAGLRPLIAFVERWLSPAERLDFFGGAVTRRLDFEIGVAPSSPLYPIGCLYRARMLVWVTLESSGIYPFPERRARYLDRARRLFTLASCAFPENRVIRMYLGEPMPPEKHYAAVEGAPSWAVLQREALERLTDVIEWWIDHRLRENGEYGGGWGDDCEMWRHWVPILVGFEHPGVRRAQTFFSRQLLRQPHLRGGYHARMTDVEHSAEDLSDSLTPLMLIDPDDAGAARRVARLLDLMDELWTGRNARGLLQFKSTYFTADRVDLTPARACDTVYHPRAMQPALLYWLRTADRRPGRLFTAWMDTWVDAAAREERGKPAGILPTAIHWPGGRVGGAGSSWWKPENYSTPLYDFPSAMYMMTKTLLLTHHMTGDARYLEPIRTMARARLEHLEHPRKAPSPGSRAWCAERLGTLGESIAKYRFLTGDGSFDRLLTLEGDPYVLFRLRGDREPLERGLRECLTTLRHNFPAYTSEVRYTDRVFRFPILYEPGYLVESAGSTIPVVEKGVLAQGMNRLSLLYSTATGDPGDVRYFPMNALRWLTPPRDLAALVTSAAPRRLAARLFHFGPSARSLGAEFYLLERGAHRWRLAGDPAGETIETGKLEVTGPRARIAFTLPPRRECLLEVRRESP